MEILTIMVVGRTAKQVKCEGYKIKVNENSFLVFESKEHYKNIKRLEKSLFNLVKYVLINGIDEEVYEIEKAFQRESELKLKYKCGCESESESDKLVIYNMALSFRFNSIVFKVGKFPLTEVNIFELEKNENLDNPFEIKFPTLLYFFMTKHKKGYSNYKLFCKKIKSRDLELDFKYLRESIGKVTNLNKLFPSSYIKINIRLFYNNNYLN